jgi:NitT/TauT family transport system ATP-binding protein
MASAITATGLGFAYTTTDPNAMVVRSLELEVKPGEVVCLFGPNGCGKSTVLRLCAGLLEPTVGTVEILGRAPKEVDIGYLPQTFGESLFPWLTVLNNVAFPLYMNAVTRSAAHKRAQQSIERLPLSIPIDRRPAHLSVGQQQLACLARAMVLSPQLLLADEPFSALDFRTRVEMQDVFQEVLAPATGIAGLLVSHHVEDAVYMADRVIVTTELPLRTFAAFDVSEPRPRDRSFKRSSAFFDLSNAITEAFLEVTER